MPNVTSTKKVSGLDERKKAEKSKKAMERRQAAAKAKGAIKKADVKAPEPAVSSNDKSKEAVEDCNDSVVAAIQTIKADVAANESKCSPVAVEGADLVAPAEVHDIAVEDTMSTMEQIDLTVKTTKPAAPISTPIVANGPSNQVVTYDTRISELNDILPVPPGFENLTFREYYTGATAVAVREKLEADLFASMDLSPPWERLTRKKADKLQPAMLRQTPNTDLDLTSATAAWKISGGIEARKAAKRQPPSELEVSLKKLITEPSKMVSCPVDPAWTPAMGPPKVTKFEDFTPEVDQAVLRADKVKKQKPKPLVPIPRIHTSPLGTPVETSVPDNRDRFTIADSHRSRSSTVGSHGIYAGNRQYSPTTLHTPCPPSPALSLVPAFPLAPMSTSMGTGHAFVESTVPGGPLPIEVSQSFPVPQPPAGFHYPHFEGHMQQQQQQQQYASQHYGGYQFPYQQTLIPIFHLPAPGKARRLPCDSSNKVGNKDGSG